MGVCEEKGVASEGEAWGKYRDSVKACYGQERREPIG